MVDGVIRLDESRAFEEDFFSRKWIQLKGKKLHLYPTDMIGFSEKNTWKPIGTVELHPHGDTNTSIVNEDVEPPQMLRMTNRDRIDRDNDVRCFKISVKNPENEHARLTTLCALSENSRAYWIEGIRLAEQESSSSRSRSNLEKEALSKKSPSEDRVNAFARLPWAQRTFKGFMTFECARNEHVTSASAFSSVCEPVRYIRARSARFSLTFSCCYHENITQTPTLKHRYVRKGVNLVVRVDL